MKFILWLLLCLFVFSSGCAEVFAGDKDEMVSSVSGKVMTEADDQTDQRLAQSVSYEAGFRTVEQVLDDLSKMTGIKLIAGSSKSDWQVRSRRMNIFVKDVKMADLMNSMAHAMKFSWRCYDQVEPTSYRLVVHYKSAAEADKSRELAEKKKEEQWQKRRQEWIDTITKYGEATDSELESLRDTDPLTYGYGKRGAIRALHALFEEVPETKDRFSKGMGFRISANKLDPHTKNLLFLAGNELWRYLQIVGIAEKNAPTPTGYGDELKYEEKFDISLDRLDVGAFTPNLRWGSASRGCTGYFHIARGYRDFEIANLSSRDSVWDRYRIMVHNKILDGAKHDQAWDSSESHYKRSVEDRKKEEEELYPSEPLNEHPDFPELEKAIKLKVEVPKEEQEGVMAFNSYIASFQKALTEASGLGVVSDSWVNIQGEKVPDQEAKLGELLDKFSSQFNYNWDKSSNILEFRHRKWWKNRLNQIPEQWVTMWRESTCENGILGLEDMASISCLTYEQAEESLKMDKVLGLSGLYREILRVLDTNSNIHCLRLYSSLNSQQRRLLTSKNGLYEQLLSKEQWKHAQYIFDRIATDRADAIFRMDIHTNGKVTNCHFMEYDGDLGKEDRMWVVNLLHYQRPATQEAESAGKATGK